MNETPLVMQSINAHAAERMKQDASVREAMIYKWLHENWSWYLRWAIGYPKAIKWLSRLRIVRLPVLVEVEAD